MVDPQQQELSVRERIGLRILAAMHRIVQPHRFSHQADRALSEILEEIGGTRDGES